MVGDSPQSGIQRFLHYRRYWVTGLLLTWMVINVSVLATSKLMESQREGKSLPAWEPWCWEISSNLMVLLLIPLGIYLHDHWFSRFNLKTRIALHAFATLPFSLIHVIGMVSLRHLCYSFMDSHYVFGDPVIEFFYEYRKDVQGYLFIALLVAVYRFIISRLQGEASYLAEGEENEGPETVPPPERLLVKKMGREFLIKVSDIEWIEASGNYANLHLKNHVYPMRITMEKLEKMLPANFVRVHRSSIVNLTQVEQIQPLDSGDHEITLHCQKTLVLSRRYREKFKELLALG
jgi:hypothetical protein